MDPVSNKELLVRKYGKWTCQNIKLSDSLYTVGPDETANGHRTWKILNLVSGLAHKSLDEISVADLGCLEGQFGLEFAMHGSRVSAIEFREPNIEKAKFAQSVLGLDNIHFYRDDIRNFTPEKYGEFDVVLCLGVFYHLDSPDIFTLMENLFRSCRDLLILDTHISLQPQETFTYKGEKYYGEYHKEGKAWVKETDSLEGLWSSVKNQRSVWLTFDSLQLLLKKVGFTLVLEKDGNDVWGKKREDRVLLAASKKKPVALRTYPYPKSK